MPNDLQLIKPNRIWLKNYSEFDEAWLKKVIADDPSILELGDLILKDTERLQPKAGRLDMLFQEVDNDKRYEVEIMLGKVDESHIIRCIEYWDIERKKYKDYDHCAVLVAEEINSRFLNVISLFNGAIPMIALQLNAFQIENKMVLTFTKVMDEITLISEEDDDDLIERRITDRNYWDNRASAISMKLTDDCIHILKEISSDLSPNYVVHYIGLLQRHRPNNFVIFKPKKKYLRIEIRLNDVEAWKEKFETTDIEVVGINKRKTRIIYILNEGEVSVNREFLRELFMTAFNESIV